jgi:hypothetical protein
MRVASLIVLFLATACTEHPIGDPAGSNNFDDPDDPGQSGQNSSGPDASGDASGRFCVAARDCPAAFVCAYPIADACGASGRCLPYGIACDASAACGCDGTSVPLCAPAGFAPKPVKSESACNAPPSDAGIDAGSDASDAAGE